MCEYACNIWQTSKSVYNYEGSISIISNSFRHCKIFYVCLWSLTCLCQLIELYGIAETHSSPNETSEISLIIIDASNVMN